MVLSPGAISPPLISEWTFLLVDEGSGLCQSLMLRLYGPPQHQSSTLYQSIYRAHELAAHREPLVPTMLAVILVLY